MGASQVMPINPTRILVRPPVVVSGFLLQPASSTAAAAVAAMLWVKVIGFHPIWQRRHRKESGFCADSGAGAWPGGVGTGRARALIPLHRRRMDAIQRFANVHGALGFVGEGDAVILPEFMFGLGRHV